MYFSQSCFLKLWLLCAKKWHFGILLFHFRTCLAFVGFWVFCSPDSREKRVAMYIYSAQRMLLVESIASLNHALQGGLSNPIFRFLRSNTLISKFSCSNVCKTLCLRWHSRAVGNNPFQSCSIDWDRGTNRWNFLLSWLSRWMLTMDHVKWPMNMHLSLFPLGTFLKTFLAFFPKNLLYWNRKFIEIQLYICIFGVPGIRSLVCGGILCLFIPLNLYT